LEKPGLSGVGWSIGKNVRISDSSLSDFLTGVRISDISAHGTRGRYEKRTNPKFEARNPKQFPNAKFKCPKHQRSHHQRLGTPSPHKQEVDHLTAKAEQLEKRLEEANA
jgi:hypothetical protein